MKRYIATLAGLVLGLAACLTVAVGAAAPASATISFCQTAKNSPCIGPVNGCHLTLGVGKYAFAETGDQFIDGSGQKFTCQNGKWVKTAASGSEVQIGGNLGRGVVVQGPPGNDSGGDGCNPVQIACPPVVIP